MDSDASTKWQWDVADTAANPEEHCLFNEVAGIVDRAIHTMPLPLRRVTELRLVQNLDLPEIADTLDISIPATKSRLYRAKRRIAKTLRGTSKREMHLHR
jgi:RNA polymerase sigma-70 factor (ECF subfamily)